MGIESVLADGVGESDDEKDDAADSRLSCAYRRYSSCSMESEKGVARKGKENAVYRSRRALKHVK